MRAVPDLVWFLAVGLTLGNLTPGLPTLLTHPAVPTLLGFGAAWLIFEGGAGLRWQVLKPVFGSVVLLATVGVVLTAGVVALAAWGLGMSPSTALLLGALVASTDPATLVPLFAQVRVTDRVAQAVVAESALNDAVGALLTLVAASVVTSGSFDLATVTLDLGWKVLSGVALGTLLGWWGRRLGRQAWVAGLAAYAIAEVVHGSGFLAALAAGFVAARHDPRWSMFVRGAVFGLLGALVPLGALGTVLISGLGLLAALLFLARPAAVWTCTLVDRWSAGERWFLCWTRETGVIPAALVATLTAQGVPGMAQVTPLVFVVIVGTIVVQVPTTGWWARRTGVATP